MISFVGIGIIKNDDPVLAFSVGLLANKYIKCVFVFVWCFYMCRTETYIIKQDNLDFNSLLSKGGNFKLSYANNP